MKGSHDMKGYPSIKRGEAGTLNVPATVETPTAYRYAITIRSGAFYKTLTATYADGKMSAADKSKLDGVETEANKYVHPTQTAHASGLYKIATEPGLAEQLEEVKLTLALLGGTE